MVEQVTRGILTAPTGEQVRAAAERAMQNEERFSRRETARVASDLTWVVTILAAGLAAIAFFALVELGRGPADPLPNVAAPQVQEPANQVQEPVKTAPSTQTQGE